MDGSAQGGAERSGMKRRTAEKRRRRALRAAKRGERIEVRVCDRCVRGYTYCNPFDRYYPGDCPRRGGSIWDDSGEGAWKS